MRSGCVDDAARHLALAVLEGRSLTIDLVSDTKAGRDVAPSVGCRDDRPEHRARVAYSEEAGNIDDLFDVGSAIGRGRDRRAEQTDLVRVRVDVEDR